MMKASFIFSQMQAGCSFGAVLLPIAMPPSPERDSLQEDPSHLPEGCGRLEGGAPNWRQVTSWDHTVSETAMLS